MPHRALAAVCLGTGLGILLASASGCSRAPEHPNLLLVTVDTLRFDRLGLGGHDRPTSPTLDRFAREAVLFRRSYSQAGWTLPSLASLFTGQYPGRHGAVDFDSGVDPGLPTLATLLSAAGYDTRAFVSHVLLRPEYGLARGFDRYDGSVLRVGNPHEVSTAGPLTDRAVAALAEMRPPFFLWVHYFDPHFNYLRHPQWAAFGDGLIDRYDQEIAFTDQHIGLLLDALTRSGHAADTVVVLTADHGEAFGEHGARFHFTVDEEVIHVPLLVRAPGLAPGERTDLSQQVDLLPTLLGLLHVPAPPALPGRDLFAPGSAETPVFVERTDPTPWRQRAVIRGHEKLVVSEVVPGRETVEVPGLVVHPGVFLYDLADDPGERRNLYAPESPTVRELRALLDGTLGAPEAGRTPIEVNEDLREKLQALGYAP